MLEADEGALNWSVGDGSIWGRSYWRERVELCFALFLDGLLDWVGIGFAAVLWKVLGFFNGMGFFDADGMFSSICGHGGMCSDTVRFCM